MTARYFFTASLVVQSLTVFIVNKRLTIGQINANKWRNAP
jgi:hypothetical protein